MSTQSAIAPELAQLLDVAISKGASDVHLTPGVPPTIRIDSQLYPLDLPALDADRAMQMVGGFLAPEQRQKLIEERHEVDFSFTYGGHRWRANAYLSRGVLALALRLLPVLDKSLEELGAPSILAQFARKNQGLVIVTGPTGHGKSTTLAALINQIARERRDHILTIEDPIEYLIEPGKCIVSQREVGVDTPSFASGLRAALREDPNVVMVGELRDLESMENALQIANTGHLVFTTLHTNSAAQTPSRIIDTFPAHQQPQIRAELAETLVGIVSQRLLPRIKGGRVLASEVMVATPAVRSLIREGKTYQLPNVIQTSVAEGMISLDRSLAELVNRGELALQEAEAWSLDQKTLHTYLYGGNQQQAAA